MLIDYLKKSPTRRADYEEGPCGEEGEEKAR